MYDIWYNIHQICYQNRRSAGRQIYSFCYLFRDGADGNEEGDDLTAVILFGLHL